MGSCRCVAQQKQRRHLLLPLLPLLLLLPAAIFAKGGGGHSGGRSATGHSGGRISASAGRTTRGGVRVPPSCRSCYYGSSRRMFYNRVFIFTYLGTRYRCHSCGRRSEYAVDDMEVRLQAISGSVTVQLRDNSGSQAIAAPQYTADSLGVGGTVDKAFGAELGAKVISSWWQWKTEPGRRTALSAESHGFADELAIAVTGVTRPNCTVCEPSATVQFTALFEAPTVSSATATSAAARLHAACVAEALCARCGVPSASAPNGAAAACGNSGSSSSSLSCADECAACAGNSTHSGCSTPTVAGVAQGPYLSNSSCTASSPPTGFTITACDSFGATTVVLDSELGSEIPGEGDSSGAFSTLMLTFGIICLVVICVTIARGHKSRTHEPVSQQRGGGIQELNGSRWQRRVTVVPGYGNGSTNRSPQPQGPTRNIEVQPTSTAPRQAGNEYDAHRPEPVLVAMPIVHAKEVGRAP